MDIRRSAMFNRLAPVLCVASLVFSGAAIAAQNGGVVDGAKGQDKNFSSPSYLGSLGGGAAAPMQDGRSYVGVLQKGGGVTYMDVGCTIEEICYPEPCYPDGTTGCDQPDPTDPPLVYVIPHYVDNPYMVSCATSTTQAKLNSAAFDILRWLRGNGYTNWKTYNGYGSAYLQVKYSDGSMLNYVYLDVYAPGQQRPAGQSWLPNEVLLGPDAWGYKVDVEGVNNLAGTFEIHPFCEIPR